ncbi:MAG: NAD(P)/FAD-dependent oxidoreductase [Candidatus Hodarchaeales archaeon]
MDESEILVVGAGPSGVIAALTAAKMGRKVILIDNKSHEQIGNKVCGDALNLAPVTFIEEKLGLEKPHDEEVADTVERLIFQSSNAYFPLDGDGYVLNRHQYGQRLLKIAEEYGVEVRSNTKALKCLCQDNAVVGALVRDKKGQKGDYEIHAKVTIDCSGRNFVIRRTIPESLFPYLEKKLDKRDTAASYREIIELKEDHPYHHEIYLIYDKLVPEPGYFWIFSKGEKKLNVGIGWFMDKEHRGMKECYRKVLHNYYPEGTYKVLDKGGGQIPTRYPLTNAVAPGFLTAGDAAVHVNPLSAEGHGPALVAGYYAGKTAANAIEKDMFHSEDFLWSYNVDVMKHFGLSHTKIQLFTGALNKIGVSGLEFLIRRNILTKEQFLNLHAGKKMSIADMLKIAIKAFPRYGILMQISRIGKGSQKFEKIFEKYPDNPAEYPMWLELFNSTMNSLL